MQADPLQHPPSARLTWSEPRRRRGLHWMLATTRRFHIVVNYLTGEAEQGQPEDQHPRVFCYLREFLCSHNTRSSYHSEMKHRLLDACHLGKAVANRSSIGPVSDELIQSVQEVRRQFARHDVRLYPSQWSPVATPLSRGSSPRSMNRFTAKVHSQRPQLGSLLVTADSHILRLQCDQPPTPCRSARSGTPSSGGPVAATAGAPPARASRR